MNRGLLLAAALALSTTARAAPATTADPSDRDALAPAAEMVKAQVADAVSSVQQDATPVDAKLIAAAPRAEIGGAATSRPLSVDVPALVADDLAPRAPDTSPRHALTSWAQNESRQAYLTHEDAADGHRQTLYLLRIE
jgi:hypothetical protein